MHLSAILIAAIATALAAAHLGHDHNQDMSESRAMLQHTPRELGHCAAKLRTRGYEGRSVKRRSKIAAELMQKRGLKSKLQFGRLLAMHASTTHNRTDRDLTSLLDVSHESAEFYTLDTPETTLFSSNIITRAF